MLSVATRNDSSRQGGFYHAPAKRKKRCSRAHTLLFRIDSHIPQPVGRNFEGHSLTNNTPKNYHSGSGKWPGNPKCNWSGEKNNSILDHKKKNQSRLSPRSPYLLSSTSLYPSSPLPYPHQPSRHNPVVPTKSISPPRTLFESGVRGGSRPDDGASECIHTHHELAEFQSAAVLGGPLASSVDSCETAAPGNPRHETFFGLCISCRRAVR